MNVDLNDVSREQLLNALYEAAELEHNLMCTYLYAAFSLRDGVAEGLSPLEAEAVARWRKQIISVAIEEMGHLTAVWNITSALGGLPTLRSRQLSARSGQSTRRSDCQAGAV
ncbi:MAG: ferritin-like domain-containing protein [Steroidobacterales bacterium]